MRVSRLLISSWPEADALLVIRGESSHYLRQVLRLRKGFLVTLFDGQGLECEAAIEAFGRDETHLRLLRAPEAVSRESPLEIHLTLGISRSERMDLAIQKAVELGVRKISPIFTEFGVVRLDEEKKITRHLHWRRIIQSACEQCGQNRLPTLSPPESFEAVIERQAPAETRLLIDPTGTNGFRGLPRPEGPLQLLIGPEGGFSKKETERAQQQGWCPVALGPRILRTETAVIATMAAVQTLWGDLGG